MNFKEKGVIMGSQVGFLDLSQELMETLICTDPITDHYEVEMTPFARGKFAAVRRVRCLQTGEYYAAKVVRRRRRARDIRYETLHEAAVLCMAKGNPKIIRLHKVFEGPSEMTLILELASGGELQRVIEEEERIEERTVRKYLTHILTALRFLHSHNIAHLDLKPQNLLLTGPHPGSDVKLCDFGISRVILADSEVREVVGTPDYVAPEILQYEPISLATDMWSVGVLAYVLLTGHSPFGGDTKQETFLNISQCQLDFPEDIFAGVSSLAKEFISKLLVVEPEWRLTVEEALNHPWLSSPPCLPPACPPQPLSPPPVQIRDDLDTLYVAPLKRSSSPPKQIVANKENNRNLLNSPLLPSGSSPPSKRECRESNGESEAEVLVGGALPHSTGGDVMCCPLPPQSPRLSKPQNSPKQQPRTPNKERGRVSRQIKSIEMRLQTCPSKDDDADDDVTDGGGGGGLSSPPPSVASIKAKFTNQINMKINAMPSFRRNNLNKSFGSIDQHEETKERVNETRRLSPLCSRKENNNNHHHHHHHHHHTSHYHHHSQLQANTTPPSPSPSPSSSSHDKNKYGTRRDFQDIVIRNGYIY